MVDVRDAGRQRLYRLNGAALKPIHDWVKTYEQSWNGGSMRWTSCWKNSNRRSKEMAVATSGTAKVSLPTDTQILIEREFDAPKHLVYKAWTTPELVERWWGGQHGEVTLVEIDLRVGGTWRYVLVANEGFEVGFHGEYQELVPNERIVSTEVFEGYPDAASMNTLTLTEVDGRTTMSVLVQHSTKEHRDGHIDSGMEGGMQQSMDLLEQVAISLI